MFEAPLPSTPHRSPAAAARPRRLHRLTLALAVCSALLLVATPQTSLAAEAATPSPAVAAALAQFDQASAGQGAAADAAAEQFRSLSAADPGNPVLRAYAGAATTMQARSALLPWKKLGLVEDGLALIDKALAQLTPAHDTPGLRGVPASLETRFTAASTFLALPAMFNRHDRGERLLAELLANAQLASAPLPFQAAVWLRAGMTAADAHQAEQARQWFDKAARSATPVAAAAQARLAQLDKTAKAP